MASPVERYQREMHRNINLFATWLPGDRIEPGDVGVLKDGQFRLVKRLADLEIDVAAQAAGSAQQLSYQSTAGTNVTFSGGADAPGAKAEVSIEFSQLGSFLFAARGARKVRIANRSEVAERVLALFESDQWEKSWYLVEEVYLAESVTVVVCQGNSGSLKLSGELSAGELGLQGLTSPTAALSVTRETGKVVHVLGVEDASPLYNCSKVTTPWFGDADLEPATRSRNRDSRPQISQSPLDDLLKS